MTDHRPNEAREIEDMLPWYEKGTLSPTDMHRVADYLEAHPEMRSRLALIREELAETIAANESLGMPSAAARDRLFEAIAAEPAAMRRGAAAGASWWRRFVPDGMPPRLALASAAAILVIVLQSAALFTVTLTGPGSDYRVASGGEDAAARAGAHLFVRFAGEATADEISALMQSLGAVVVDGPKPGGVFRIRISPRELTAEERDATIQKLREKTDIISFVAPAG